MKMLRTATAKILGSILLGTMATTGLPVSAQTNTSAVATAIPSFEATGRLMNALQYGGSIQDIKQLLEQGADVSACDSSGWHALQLAVKRDNIEMVKMLLDKGANVNAENSQGVRSLDIAAVRGHADIVKLLLDRGADVNVTPNDDSTALSGAVYADNQDIVGLLLDKGANINWTDKSGDSLLTIALVAGSTNAAKCLIHRGININLEDNKGFSALDMAMLYKDTEIIEMLKQAGAGQSSASRRFDSLKNDTASTVGSGTLLESTKTSYLPDVAPPPENDTTPRAGFTADNIVDGDGYVTNADLLKPFTVTNSAGVVFNDAVLVKLMPTKFMYRTSSGAMGTQNLELLPQDFLQKIGFNPAAARAANQVEARKKANAQEQARSRWAAQQSQRSMATGAAEDIALAIKERAAKNWPGNYEMQQYEVNQQTEAYNWVVTTTYISGLSSGVLEQIKADAAEQWPGDYRMQKYEIEKQAKAYVALH